MNKYDKDGDGRLDLKEFIPFVKIMVRKLEKVDHSRKRYLYNAINGSDIDKTAEQIFAEAD